MKGSKNDVDDDYYDDVEGVDNIDIRYDAFYRWMVDAPQRPPDSV
jgi:hypothetical protein